jgi:NAD(P)-dependent dehydrogenase (short-subunit alcohol dehydrogenase family)
MSTFDAFGYTGKRVLVVGGASGMGRATAEVAKDAGAEVVVLDYVEAPLAGTTFVKVNLAEQASIDSAVATVLAAPGSFDAVFSCAGVADGTPGLEKINFTGHRHLINSLLAAERINRGGAIGFISSAAGMGWAANLDLLTQLLDTPDMETGSQWMIENNHADYMHSKQAICAYVAREALPLLKKGIRINAICPGPTETPLAEANKETWLGFAGDYRAEAGTEPSTALEQAWPLVFLCSNAAKAITGITLVSDAGYFSAGISGSFPPATMIAKFLMGMPMEA